MRSASFFLLLVFGVLLSGPRPGAGQELFTTRNCDCNGDQARDISDATYLLGWLFLGGKPLAEYRPDGVHAAATILNGDCNGDKGRDISDATYLLGWLFLGGQPPVEESGECRSGTYEARQKPGALLILLDRSSSMSQNDKWALAAEAIVQALDRDVFDSLHLGLLAAPSGAISGPACIFGLPVGCRVPPLPQLSLQPAGPKSSESTGHRRAIKDWLSANNPDSGGGDSFPLYGAMETALGALRSWPGDGHRILLVLSDGGIGCGQLSSRPGYPDCNGCDHEWEDPRNIVNLVAQARGDSARPIETFVIGLPGADTYDETGCIYPPYHMRLALSAIAAAGSPEQVPAGCDGRVFTQLGANPLASCHFDLTQGNFNAQLLQGVISLARSQVLGCRLDLPSPPDGGPLDLDKINVTLTVDGATSDLVRCTAPATCSAPGWWDYTSDGSQIELFGAACSGFQAASSAQVNVVVGCPTVRG